jgi:hypothetical protein
MKGPTPTIVAHAFWQTHFNPWKVNLFSAMLKMAEQTNEHIYLFLRTSSALFNPFFFISTNTNFAPTGKFSSTTNNQQDRPDEIYVPTATVQLNVDFLRTMSVSAIWKNVPSAIRSLPTYFNIGTRKLAK